jgi:hypothetical protein
VIIQHTLLPDDDSARQPASYRRDPLHRHESGGRDAIKIVRYIGSESLLPEIFLDSLVGHRGPVHP